MDAAESQAPAIALPPALPPTIEDVHVSLPLMWPGHGQWRVWLVAGGHEFAIDAQQLFDFAQITDTRVLQSHPLTWWHEHTEPGVSTPVTLCLYSSGAARRLLITEFEPNGYGPGDPKRARELLAWLQSTYETLCAEDPERILEEALPVRRHSKYGEEFTAAAAASRLAVRYGAKITRARVFMLMHALEWIERDAENTDREHWTVTLTGRARNYVYSRTVKIPGGSYEQVFISQDGLKKLAEHIRDVVEPPLVDLTETDPHNAMEAHHG